MQRKKKRDTALQLANIMAGLRYKDDDIKGLEPMYVAKEKVYRAGLTRGRGPKRRGGRRRKR